MAVSTAEKQAWLAAKGKPKSLSYFMTGPNLGPDWDWNKAIAGSYAPYEEFQFLETGETKYKAHKTKSKKTKAVDPGGPDVAVGASCAKTAAKSVVSWVTQATENAMQWWTYIGSDVFTGKVPVTSPGAYKKVLQAQIKEALGELGPDAPEVAAMRALADLMDNAETVRSSQYYLEQVASALKAGDSVTTGEMLTVFDSVSSKLKKVDSAQIAAIYKADWGEGAGQIIDQIQQKITAKVALQRKQAVGKVWDEILGEAPAGTVPGWFPYQLDEAVFDSVNDFLKVKWAGLNGHELLNADEILEGLDKVGELNLLWQKKVFSGADEQIAFGWQGEIANNASDALGDLVNAMSDLVDGYTNPNFWLAGFDDGVESALEKWAKVYGADLKEGVIGEIEQYAFKLEKAAIQGGVWSDTVVKSMVKQITEQDTQILAAIDQALDASKFKLPGSVATKEEVLAKLEQGHVAAMKAAGTDELNPLVQLKLEEVYGEPKTLTYFMTKEQKVDLLLLPKETFDVTEYVVKYKGDTLTGNGLITSKAKYDIKNGKIKTLTPTQASQKATEAVQDVVTGAMDDFTVPPGSPKWWADPISDAQQAVLTKEINKAQGFEKAVSALPDSKAFKFVDGTMTKGQASQLIGEIKAGKVDWDAGDLDYALSYGQKKKIVTADDAIKAKVAADPEPLVEDIVQAVQAVESGPAVSGSMQATSSAAPKNVNWDQPHQFTYVGDGSKWGGAHRKWHFTDEDGADWMLKNDSTTFRAEGELAAHKIGQLAGFDIAEARVTTQLVGGTRKRGFMQKMYRKQDIKGELSDTMSGGSFVGLDANITRQVQEHQVLDWLIGNHDGHKQNFLVMSDGRVVGIDKGQAFKFLGKDELSAAYTPNGNFGEVAYNRMWAEYRAGKIDLDLDSIADALRRVEAIDDDVYRAAIREYAEGRFAAGRSAGFLQGTSARNVDEFVEMAVERKRQIRQQFTTFYEENAQQRGVTWKATWTDDVPVKTAPAKTYKAGEVLTPIDDELAAALQRAGTQGKALYVAGSDVERGQMLYDIVADSQGNQVLRLHARLRPDADRRMMQLISEEGGDSLKTTATVKAPLPNTPQAVTQISQDFNTATQGAKTINHHISTGDFEFNQSTIEQVKVLKVKFGGDQFADLGRSNNIPKEKIDEVVAALAGKAEDEIEAALVTAFDDIAARLVQRRGTETLIGHLDGIIEQAGKGAAAQKVPFIPTFDAVKEFESIKNAALVRARKALEGKAAEKVVETVAPDKVFARLKSGRFQTTKTVKGSGVGADRRIAKLASDAPDVMDGSSTTIVGATEDGVEILYTPHANNSPTDQGFLEILVRTDGEVTTEDIAKAYEVATRRLGVDAALADVEAMELTYWRMVHGTYRSSKEAQQVSSKYYKALDLGDQRLRALGANPTPQEEIEAIKGAWRQVFGSHVDDADYLPVHNHALASHLEEVGFGQHVRPELTAADLTDLDGYNVVHHFTGGSVDESYFKGAMRDGLHAGAERRRIGYWQSYGDSMSAAADVPTGGSSSMFFRIKSTRSGAQANSLVVDPKSTVRFLGNYNSPHDRYGNVSLRTQLNHLDPRRWGDYARQSSNEVMIRDYVSWVDNAEVVFFKSEAQARAAQQVFKDAGLGVLRGVKIEERFVSVANPSSYLTDFRNKYLKGKVLPVRWTAEALRSGAQAVTQTVQRTAASLKRLKIKAGNQLGKKLSAGRQAAVQLTNITTTAGNNWGWMGIRKHPVENAISIPVSDMRKIGWIDTDDEVKSFMDALGIKDWAHGGDQAFKIGRSAYKGPSVVMDLSPWGVDFRDVSKYEQDRLLREFVQAVNDGTLADFAKTWGTV